MKIELYTGYYINQYKNNGQRIMSSGTKYSERGRYGYVVGIN